MYVRCNMSAQKIIYLWQVFAVWNMVAINLIKEVSKLSTKLQSKYFENKLRAQ